MTLQARLDALDARKIFFVGLIIAASGVVSTPVALDVGLCFGLLLVHPCGGRAAP